VESEAVLYVGLGCDVCEPVAGWIGEREPHGLRLIDAACWPGDADLRRVTYVGADGYRADGVQAVARALDHTNLGLALIGWILRMPVIAQVTQVLLDATGAGPRVIARR
jgi:hypothetical protein